MKHILVHLDASPRARVRLALAQQLALQHGARLTALYGVRPAALASPWLPADTAADAAAALARLDLAGRSWARACFERTAGGVPLDWADGGDTPAVSLLQHALYADLVVLGQTEPDAAPDGPPPPGLVPDTLFDSGRPTLLVPLAGTPAAVPQCVLVAWTPSREAARAVTAALPWLRLACEVHLAVQTDPADGPLQRGAALAGWLALHGIAGTQVHDLGPGDAGLALLRMAAAHAADLLVMGGCGRRRLRDWALGNATRTLLQAMTLPVLMVH